MMIQNAQYKSLNKESLIKQIKALNNQREEYLEKISEIQLFEKEEYEEFKCVKDELVSNLLMEKRMQKD